MDPYQIPTISRECGGGRHTLVDISLGVVAGLILLVDESILSGRCTRSERCVRVLCDSLVGLLGSLSSGTLDSLADVVCGVL